jgi:drug/metabolite transporter (DMT)-like permease
MKQHHTLKSTLILTLTAFIWGMGFVAQKSGMAHVGPFFFSVARMTLGSLTLLAVILVQQGIRRVRKTTNVNPSTERVPVRFSRLVKGGLACGLILFLAGNFQQIGLVFTTASKAGFLTTLYIVLVPILGMLLKHKTHWNTWVSVLIAAAGLYFLCVTTSLNIQPGDLIILVGALFWASHILVVDHFVQSLSRTDVMKLCAIQFAVSATFSLIFVPLDSCFLKSDFSMEALSTIFSDGFGFFDWGAVATALPALCYSGFFSTGAGFTLQAVGQKYANPSTASIIMSLEAVFSALGAMVILGEMLSLREWIGCILMFGAVILAQMPIQSRSH